MGIGIMRRVISAFLKKTKARVIQKYFCTTWNFYSPAIPLSRSMIEYLKAFSYSSDIPMVRSLLVDSWNECCSPLCTPCQTGNHLDLYQFGIVTLCSCRIRSLVDLVAYTSPLS